MRALLVLLCFGVLTGCKRKTIDIQETEIIQRPGTDTPVPSAQQPRRLDAPVMQGVLRVRATMNGGPIPEGIKCDAVVYEQGSSVAVRGKGDCEASIAVEPGTLDVDVRLSTMGDVEIHKRLNGERIGGEPKELAVDVGWAVGRLRVSHQDAPGVQSCQVAIKGTKLSGPDSTTFTLPAGTYTVDFDCVGTTPTRTSVANLVVAQGRDTVGVYRLQADVAPSQIPPQPQSLPPEAIVQQPAPPGQWGVPGMPHIQPGPMPPQSNKTEDLTVQSYNGK